MVLHDHNGILQAAASYSYLATSSPEVAEILACRSRLQLAQELNIQKVHMELDCKGVALMLNCHANDLSASGPLIKDIKERLRTFQESKVD